MPYAENQGVRIYYEVEGQGPPLVMAHGMGFGSDLNAWRSTGYTDGLKNDFTLILYDIRGHGKSDKTHLNSGSNPVNDVVAILDALDIDQAHFLGYSMGASVGFKQAIHHPGRFLSFMLGGMTAGPWPQEMVEAINISIELARLRRSDPEAYFVRMEKLLGHSLNPEERKEMLAKDTDSDVEEQRQHRDAPAMTERQLAGIEVPCLLYCGDQDPFHDGAEATVQPIPRAVFVSLDGLNHITAFYRSDVVVPLVKQFLTLVSRG